jgi:hypothetical protein
MKKILPVLADYKDFYPDDLPSPALKTPGTIQISDSESQKL